MKRTPRFDFNNNTEFSTSVQGNSMSLIDYIITDLPQIENVQTDAWDTLLRALHGKNKYHYDTSFIPTITMTCIQKLRLEKFDETHYKAQRFQQLLNNSVWGNISDGSWPRLLWWFVHHFQLYNWRRNKQCAPMKTVLIGTDKNYITIQQKRVTEETRKP